LYDALTITGTLHIAALSGMNINLVISFFALTLGQIFSKRVSSLLTIVGIIAFINLVGPSGSVVRAAIMGSINLIAIIFGRQYWAILSWLLAVIGMLLLNLGWLTDLSFQLSALASLGIIIFSRSSSPPEVVNRNLDVSSVTSRNETAHSIVSTSLGSEEPRNFIGSPTSWLQNFVSNSWFLIEKDLRLTLSAQVFTIPLIFLHFHRISLISPVTNLLIGWVIGPISVLGWLAAIGGGLWLGFGKLLILPVWALLEYLMLAVRWTAKIPLASVGW